MRYDDYFATAIAAEIAGRNQRMSPRKVAERAAAICNELNIQVDKQLEKEKKASDAFLKCRETDRKLQALEKERKRIDEHMTELHKKPILEDTRDERQKLTDEKANIDMMKSGIVEAIRKRVAAKHHLPESAVRDTWSW